MRCLLNTLGALTLALGVPSLSFSQNGAAYTYYFSHLVSGGIWCITFTYVNLTDNYVTCNTNFYSESGGFLTLSFGGVKTSLVPYSLVPRGTIHAQTDANPSGAVQAGWAKAV